METRTWTENGTPVSKEKTVAFSGHRTNRIAKFTADREKLFREVAFDTFVAIESYFRKNRHKAQRNAKFYINKCRSASCMQGGLKQASA